MSAREEAESQHTVSSDARKTLAEPVLGKFKLLSSSTGEDAFTIAIDVIAALRRVLPTDDKLYSKKSLERLDIFTPLWSCKSNGPYTRDIQLDILSILIAYCSVLPFLQVLITNSIKNWISLAQVNQPSVAQSSHNNSNGKGDKNASIDNNDGTRDIGFYTVVSMISELDRVDPDILQTVRFNLGSVLIETWIPMWVSLGSLEKYPSTGLSVFPLISTEAGLDFFIAVLHPRTFISKTTDGNNKSTRYFSARVAGRMCLFKRWLDPQDYSYAYEVQMLHTTPAGMEELVQLTAASGLKVIMEVLNHPEYNYLEEPYLCMLVYVSLDEISKNSVHKLHAAMRQFATTQSLYAIINIVQFSLAAYIINVFNALNYMTNETKFFNVPKWFIETILPPIPPISRSMFTFSNNISNGYGSERVLELINLLLRCLELTVMINSRILKEYKRLGIDPLDFSCNINNDIKPILVREYMELYLIPLFTTLALSNRLQSGSNIFNRRIDRGSISRRTTDDNNWDFTSTTTPETTASINTPSDGETACINNTFSSFSLHSMLLFYHLTELCKNLLHIDWEVTLIHLIEFISKISAESLVFQKVSVQLLNQLFFETADADSAQSLRALCRDNELCSNALHSYIDLWNDGSSLYTKIFEEIFGEEQPEVGTILLNTHDLVESLPSEMEDESRKDFVDRDEQIASDQPSGPASDADVGVRSNQRDNYGHSRWRSSRGDPNQADKRNNYSPQPYAFSSVGLTPYRFQAIPQAQEGRSPGFRLKNSGHWSVKSTENYIANNNSRFVGGTGGSGYNIGSMRVNKGSSNTVANIYGNNPPTPFPRGRRNLFQIDTSIGMGSIDPSIHQVKRQDNIHPPHMVSPRLTSNPIHAGDGKSLSPALSTQLMTANTWNNSPVFLNGKEGSTKIVSTGKKYILGGDNGGAGYVSRSNSSHSEGRGPGNNNPRR